MTLRPQCSRKLGLLRCPSDDMSSVAVRWASACPHTITYISCHLPRRHAQHLYAQCGRCSLFLGCRQAQTRSVPPTPRTNRTTSVNAAHTGVAGRGQLLQTLHGEYATRPARAFFTRTQLDHIVHVQSAHICAVTQLEDSIVLESGEFATPVFSKPSLQTRS